MTEPTGNEAAIRDFENAWQRGDYPSIDDYLPQCNERTRPGEPFAFLLKELICIDLEFRWQNLGVENPKRVEDYVAEFPQLNSVDEILIELAIEEYRARHRWGDAPAHEEYAARFMSDRKRLCAALERVDDEMHAEVEVGSTIFVVADEVNSPVDLHATPLQFSDYLLQRQIGAGAIGKVYRAFQQSLQRTVAVKFLRKAFCSQPRAVQRFIDEARTVARLSHREIVGIHGLGRTPGGGYFIVMDYIERGDLQQQIAAGEVIHREAVNWVAEACEAIQHAHDHGVIHCDLKPANLLLDEAGHIRVSDFGFARSLDSTEKSPAAIAGTAPYMAPEQITEFYGSISERTDVYGLGGVLYSLLTGHPPYTGKRVSDVLAKVISADKGAELFGDNVAFPPGLEAICRKCLSSDPCQRFESAAELREVLVNSVLANQSNSAGRD